MKGTRVYSIWSGMITRCTNPAAINYANYGGRGITVCERWKSFENFFADMGEPATGTTLDRKDNERGYEPGNCRWATRAEQANNTRINHHITAFGETLTVSQWAERIGVKYQTLYARITRRGWSPEKSLTYRSPQ